MHNKCYNIIRKLRNVIRKLNYLLEEICVVTFDILKRRLLLFWLMRLNRCYWDTWDIIAPGVGAGDWRSVDVRGLVTTAGPGVRGCQCYCVSYYCNIIFLLRFGSGLADSVYAFLWKFKKIVSWICSTLKISGVEKRVLLFWFVGFKWALSRKDKNVIFSYKRTHLKQTTQNSSTCFSTPEIFSVARCWGGDIKVMVAAWWGRGPGLYKMHLLTLLRL